MGTQADLLTFLEWASKSVFVHTETCKWVLTHAQIPDLPCVLSEQTQAAKAGPGQLQSFILGAHIIKESSQDWQCKFHEFLSLFYFTLFPFSDQRCRHFISKRGKKENPCCMALCHFHPALRHFYLLLKRDKFLNFVVIISPKIMFLYCSRWQLRFELIQSLSNKLCEKQLAWVCTEKMRGEEGEKLSNVLQSLKPTFKQQQKFITEYLTQIGRDMVQTKSDFLI